MSRNSLLKAGAKSEGEVTATGQISTQNTAQSFGNFGQMVEFSFKN